MTLTVAIAPPIPSPISPRYRLTRFYLLHILSALFPLTAAHLLYGWRAVALIGFSILCTAAAAWVWQRIGQRGPCLHMAHALWLSLLLAFMLPAQLLSSHDPAIHDPTYAPWAIIPASSLLLVFLLWLIGGVGFSRVHPLLLTYLLLVILFSDSLSAHSILNRTRIAAGDLADDAPAAITDDPWIAQREPTPADALRLDPNAAQRLTAYTRADKPQGNEWITLESLLRDQLPPLEDLVIGGHPGPLGASSAIAVIIGGLFLLYRGLIDYRIPLLMILAAYLAFLVLPVPTVVSAEGAQYHPLILPRAHQDIATVLTFANYQTLGSPLLFAAFFIATSPSVSPITPRRRKYFAIFCGLLAAVCQLYFSCSFGVYVAILLASLISLYFNARAATQA
jgi:Na+-translocating ferredoxin:NAD+ oxidoreductase RnfD subunit